MSNQCTSTEDFANTVVDFCATYVKNEAETDLECSACEDGYFLEGQTCTEYSTIDEILDYCPDTNGILDDNDLLVCNECQADYIPLYTTGYCVAPTAFEGDTPDYIG